ILQAMISLVGESDERLETLIGYLEDLDAEGKRQLSWKILPLYSGYGNKLVERTEPLTPLQRRFALLILKDRSEFSIGFKALQHEPFSAEELAAFPEWLKRKGAGFRGSILMILLQQEDEKLIPVVAELLKGDVEQRLAGLDILIQLHQQERSLAPAAGWVEELKQRKLSTKEEVLLAQLTDPEPAKD